MGSIFHADSPYSLSAGASILVPPMAGAEPSPDYLVTENGAQVTENAVNATENGP